MISIRSFVRRLLATTCLLQGGGVDSFKMEAWWNRIRAWNGIREALLGAANPERNFRCFNDENPNQTFHSAAELGRAPLGYVRIEIVDDDILCYAHPTTFGRCILRVIPDHLWHEELTKCRDAMGWGLCPDQRCKHLFDVAEGCRRCNGP